MLLIAFVIIEDILLPYKEVMMMKRTVFVFVVTALAYLSFSCKESMTDSRPRIIRPPQDMLWTADTIKGIGTATQLIPDNLLVFAPNDAWLVCWSDIARGLIWHFDGKSWTESNIQKDVGGMRVNDIAGYSSNDLWTCGYTGDEIFLAHYDGTKWTKYNTNGIKGELIKMCKDAEGNIWACGRDGLILKYDKSKWVSEKFVIPMQTNSYQFFKGIQYYAGEIHLIITSMNLNNLVQTYYYVKGKSNNWTVVDSMKIDSPSSKIKWGYYFLYANSNTSLYSVGLQGCWKLNNGLWEKILADDGELYELTAMDNNYLIACSAFKTLKYFNGSIWTDFSASLKVTDPYFVFNNVWSNGFETFVVGQSNESKLIVWRGK